jgi:hypothetical protein
MTRLLSWLVLSSFAWANGSVAQIGSSATGTRADAWETRAELRVIHGSTNASDSVVVDAVLINRTVGPIVIEHGACPVRLRAFRTPDRTGSPDWKSELRSPWNGGPDYACPLYLKSVELAPSQEFSPDEFVLRVPISEVLADSLPDGVYHFTVELEVGSRSVQIPVGEAELRMERHPLPDRRDVGALTFTARTLASRTEPRVVRAEAKVTLGSTRESVVRFLADCPIVLYAYRSRERRDAAPRSGEPDWKEPRACGEGIRELRLSGDQDATFAVEFSARDVLGSTVPSGRYHFAVVVHLEGRRIFLSAGDAELRR